MADTCRFFEHSNIANFFQLDCFTFYFLLDRHWRGQKLKKKEEGQKFYD